MKFRTGRHFSVKNRARELLESVAGCTKAGGVFLRRSPRENHGTFTLLSILSIFKNRAFSAIRHRTRHVLGESNRVKMTKLDPPDSFQAAIGYRVKSTGANTTIMHELH